jgi:hypothetical protein
MYAGRSGDEAGPAGPPARHDSGRQIAWASPDGVTASVTTINDELLMTDVAVAPFGEEEPSIVPVPPLTAVAIGLCLAVTVVFGVWPSPIITFAHQASLLFPGH